MDASDERLLTEKQDLRRKMSAAREALPPDARRDAVRAACDRVAALDELNALQALGARVQDIRRSPLAPLPPSKV